MASTTPPSADSYAANNFAADQARDTGRERLGLLPADDLQKGDLGETAPEPTKPEAGGDEDRGENGDNGESAGAGESEDNSGAANTTPPEAGPDAGISIAQQRTQLMRRQKKAIAELAALGGKVSSTGTSKSARLLKFFMPGVYSRVMNAIEAPTNAGKKGMVAALQTKVTALQTGKKLLQVAQGGAQIGDAVITLGELVGATGWTVVLPIIIVIFSPVIILVLFIISFAIKGSLARAVGTVISELDKILKPLQDQLKKEKRKLQLQRIIKQTSQALAAA